MKRPLGFPFDRSTATAAILFVTISILLSCSGKSNWEFSDSFKEGMASLNKYDFAAAEQTFTKLAADQPESPEGMYGQGLLLERQLLFLDALRLYYFVALEHESFAPAYKAMARIYEHLEAFDEATEAQLKYIERTDKSASSLIDYARLALDAANITVAEDAIGRVEKSDAEPETIELLRKQLSLRQGEFGAIDDIPISLPAIGDDPVAARLTSDLYRFLGWSDSALAYSRLAVKLTQDKQDELLRHFQLSLNLNYWWEARQTMREMAATDSSGLIALALKPRYERSAGNHFAAGMAGKAFWQNRPNDYSTIFENIHCRWMVLDQMTLMSDRDRLLGMLDDDSTISDFTGFMRGYMTYHHASYTEMPTDVQVMFKSAGVKKHFPRYIGKFIELAELTGNAPISDSVINDLPDYLADNPNWLTTLGEVFASLRVKRGDTSLAIFDKVLDKYPQFWPAVAGKAEYHLQRRQWQDAIDVLAQHPQLTNINIALMREKLVALMHSGSWDEATELLPEVLGKAGGDVKLIKSLLNICRRYNHLRTADKIIDILTSGRPENPDIMEAAANHYWRIDKMKAAEDYADRGLMIEPDNVGLLSEKGAALASQGDSEGKRILEQVKKSDPGDVRMLIPYSLILARKGSSGFAENLARQAVFFGGRSDEPLLNLCEVYWLSDNPKLTRGEARKAISLDRFNPLGHYWLGRASARLNEPDVAKQELQKAIELGLYGSELKQAEATLKRL